MSLEACIDWLQFTLPESLGVEYVISSVLGLPLEDFTLLDSGKWFYAQQHKLENITVLSQGYQDNMGIHVLMTGQGVRLFESRVLGGDSDKWNWWLSFLLDLQAKFTRLDIAYDNRDDDGAGLLFDLDMVHEACKSGHRGGLLRRYQNVESYELGPYGDVYSGRTLYFGRRESNLMVRMYDKGAMEGSDYEWIRSEIESRDGRAEAIVRYLVGGKSVGEIAREVFGKYLKFRVPSGDSNRRRWSLASWWSKFVGALQGVKLTAEAPMRTIETVKNWLSKQVSTNLVMVMQALPAEEFEAWWNEFMIFGLRRLKPKHFALMGSS